MKIKVLKNECDLKNLAQNFLSNMILIEINKYPKFSQYWIDKNINK